MKKRIDELYPVISSKLIKTPLVRSRFIGKLAGCNLFLKLENQQTTNSFKYRGVLSKFSELYQQSGTLPEVAAASTGNHAAAVCQVAPSYRCHATIFVPETITRSKLARLQKSPAKIRIEGKHSGDSELIAARYAQQQQIPMIHPYNDRAVIAGQGTIGRELTRQKRSIDRVYIPVGGGGLISGVAAYLKEAMPSVQIVGVQPVNASEMADSVRLGRIVPPSTLKTLSDGTAGGLDPQTETFRFCRELVDEFVLVREDEIIKSLQLLYQHEGLIVEPAAALAVAGIVKSRLQVAGKTCVAVVSGGNIDRISFYRLLIQWLGKEP